MCDFLCLRVRQFPVPFYIQTLKKYIRILDDFVASFEISARASKAICVHLVSNVLLSPESPIFPMISFVGLCAGLLGGQLINIYTQIYGNHSYAPWCVVTNLMIDTI